MSVLSREKIFHPQKKVESMDTDPAARKLPIHMPETDWVLDDPDDIKEFHEQIDNPRIAVPGGVLIQERSSKMAEKRRAMRKAGRAK